VLLADECEKLLVRLLTSLQPRAARLPRVGAPPGFLKKAPLSSEQEDKGEEGNRHPNQEGIAEVMQFSEKFGPPTTSPCLGCFYRGQFPAGENGLDHTSGFSRCKKRLTSCAGVCDAGVDLSLQDCTDAGGVPWPS